jgi:hypothetical protein
MNAEIPGPVSATHDLPDAALGTLATRDDARCVGPTRRDTVPKDTSRRRTRNLHPRSAPRPYACATIPTGRRGIGIGQWLLADATRDDARRAGPTGATRCLRTCPDDARATSAHAARRGRIHMPPFPQFAEPLELVMALGRRDACRLGYVLRADARAPLRLASSPRTGTPALAACHSHPSPPPILCRAISIDMPPPLSQS